MCSLLPSLLQLPPTSSKFSHPWRSSLTPIYSKKLSCLKHIGLSCLSLKPVTQKSISFTSVSLVVFMSFPQLLVAPQGQQPELLPFVGWLVSLTAPSKVQVIYLFIQIYLLSMYYVRYSYECYGYSWEQIRANSLPSWSLLLTEREKVTHDGR